MATLTDNQSMTFDAKELDTMYDERNQLMTTDNMISIASAFSTRKEYLVNHMDEASKLGHNEHYIFWRGRLVEMYDSYRAINTMLNNNINSMPSNLFNLSKY